MEIIFQDKVKTESAYIHITVIRQGIAIMFAILNNKLYRTISDKTVHICNNSCDMWNNYDTDWNCWITKFNERDKVHESMTICRYLDEYLPSSIKRGRYTRLSLIGYFSLYLISKLKHGFGYYQYKDYK